MKPLKEISFNLKGWVSTNKLRNTTNRWQLNSLKNKERKRFRKLAKELLGDIQFNTPIYISVEKRSRLDVDNVSLKFFLDALTDLEIIKDDNPKFVKEVKIKHNNTLPSDCYVIRFYLAEDDEDLSSLSFPTF